MRIGELAARTGVSPHTLRVWERRYGLLQPARTASGYRLYGPDDERRVRAVTALRGRGVAAGEAAARVLATDRGSGDPATTESGAADITRLLQAMHEATLRFDERAMAATLDDVFASMSVERAICQVVLPYLHQVGSAWEQGTLTIAQEHFGSAAVRRRLSTMSHTWGVGTGPVAVLACPQSEGHDLGLLAFGVLLGRAGWRIRYLGADTPITDLARACETVQPDLVVLAAIRETAFRSHLRSLGDLARCVPVAIAGRGATPRAAAEVGATLLPEDPLAGVSEVAHLVRAAERRTQPSGSRQSPRA